MGLGRSTYVLPVMAANVSPVEDGLNPIQADERSAIARPQSYSVLDVCHMVEDTISAAFPDEIWVKGVLSGLNRSAAGHVYFDLIDPGDLGQSPDATLPVALFASSRQRVNAILRKTKAARMEDGVEIRIRGRVAYYPRQGRVQLIMSLIDPAYTLGLLEAAKAALLLELAEIGLLDANQSLRFPVLPLRVGLITSSGSAAEADFMQELAQSGLPFAVTLFDSRVQGDGAVGELISALARASADASLDVVAMIRGGGARTDLATFDNRDLALAIASSKTPVVVGVGHEIDSSVADEVAARSMKTPTACASYLVGTVVEFATRVERCRTRLLQLAAQHLERSQQRLAVAGNVLNRVSSQATARQYGHLDLAQRRLSDGTARSIERSEHQLATARLRVNALDPQAALARGWSITHTAKGDLVRSIDGVESGVRLVTTLAGGTIMSTVTEAAPDNRGRP
jgi:exodeoxyribonuclease VII large subunit